MLTTGWDVSTSIVGVSAIENGRLVWKNHIDLRKIDHLNDKLYDVRSFMKTNGFQLIGNHFIEDRLGGFTRGMTSQQTLMRLAAFNAMVSWLIEDELKTRPVPMHPSTMKAVLKKQGLIIEKGQDKKEKTLEWVKLNEPNFIKLHDITKKGNNQPWIYDEADAYGIARAGETKLTAS